MLMIMTGLLQPNMQVVWLAKGDMRRVVTSHRPDLMQLYSSQALLLPLLLHLLLLPCLLFLCYLLPIVIIVACWLDMLVCS